MALYSTRLDQASEEALASAARVRKVTRAVILREAIVEYGKVAGAEATPFDRLGSLIGVIGDGPGDVSERTGEKLGRVLTVARRAKRIAPAVATTARTRRRVD